MVYQHHSGYGDDAIAASGLPWTAAYHTQHHTPRQITMMVTVVVLVLTTASEYEPRAATAQFLPVLDRHPWWGVSLLVQYLRRSVGALSMADMVHGSFFQPIR
jgi:hypothetical protein